MKFSRFRRIAAAFAACLLLGGMGCRKGEDLPSMPAHGQEDAGLTGSVNPDLCYTADPLPLPEGYSLPYLSVPARIDPETGALSVAAEAGFGTDAHRRAVFTFSKEGELLSETEIPGDPGYSVESAAFSGSTLWYALTRFEDGEAEYRLCRMDLNAPDAPLSADAALGSLPEMPADFPIENLAADGDGALWLTSNGLTLVYTPDLEWCIGAVRAGSRISSLAVDPDGRVWGCTSFGGNVGRGAAKLNKQTGGYDEVIPLDENARNIAFSPDGALYCDTAEGICRLEQNEAGEWERTPVLDYISSGIVRSSGAAAGRNSENADLALAPSGDCFLFCALTAEGRRTLLRPVFYRKSAEAALPAEGIVTVCLAYAHELPDNIRAEIVRFNRDHPGIRVTTLDYGIYSTEDDFDGGARKLMIDMLNGIVAPDIVYGGSGNTEMLALAAKKMTVDLSPFLAGDDKVNRDNLFGSVLSFFDDGAGGLWAIAPYFSLYTWIAGPDTPGIDGGADGWTLDDFFGFAEGLPAGRFITDNAVRGTWFIGNINARFVDRAAGTCSFDSPDYVRFLRLLDSLPDREEYRKIMNRGSENYRDGTIALAEVSLEGDRNLLQWEQIFSTPDYVIVGYPSDRIEGRAKLSAGHVFAVTKTCAAPEAAWAFIRSTFRSPAEQEWRDGIGLSSLKSSFDASAEEMRNQIMIRFADGKWDNRTESPEEYEKNADRIRQEIKQLYGDIPYEVEAADEEQLGRIRAFLDRPVAPMTEELPVSVRSLIREEISAFLGGVGTAEECAAKIQSRVSLWLAEQE